MSVPTVFICHNYHWRLMTLQNKDLSDSHDTESPTLTRSDIDSHDTGPQ